jgi:kynureninase
MTHPFAHTRSLFPVLETKAQLSSCSQGALCKPVKAAMSAYQHSWETLGMDWAGWMTAVNDAKAEFGKLINADPGDIAVMGSVSDRQRVGF